MRMRLIFLYGPPAVGKLAVATELGRITGLGVFDKNRIRMREVAL